MRKFNWNNLPKPFFALAPMDDVTDTVFRQVIAKLGKPDVFFTEFTNADGICSKGFERLKKKLIFTNSERPLIAQIWGNCPETIYKATKIIVDLKFDGVDINLGCPVKNVIKKGCGAGLIRDPSLTAEIIHAARDGAGDLPLSVKTRIGFDTIQTQTWIGFLLQQNLDALTIHGRIAKDMSRVPANWDEIGVAVKLRNNMKSDTLILGNGDITSRSDAMQKYKQYYVDGIMIGRGVFQNLWIFTPDKDHSYFSMQQKATLLKKHIYLFTRVWGGQKPFAVMKKFIKIYTSAEPDSSAFRSRLMQASTPNEAIKYINDYINYLKKQKNLL